MSEMVEKILRMATRIYGSRGHEYDVETNEQGDYVLTMTRPATVSEGRSVVRQEHGTFFLDREPPRETHPEKKRSAVIDSRSARVADLSGDLVALVTAAVEYLWDLLGAPE